MKQATDEQRFSVYYAVLFGSIGAMFPFAALWMNQAGIEPAMIGVIVSGPSVAMLLTTITLGRLADNLPERRQAIIAANWIILLVHLTLFLTTKEWVVLLVWLLAGIAMYAKVPITDAAALGLARRNGSDFARVRMFGSIGFVLMLSVAGFAYERWGIGTFVMGLFIANVARLLAAYYLPLMSTNGMSANGMSTNGNSANAHSHEASILKTSTPKTSIPKTSAPKAATSISQSLYQPGILLTLIGGALINASHAMVNTYGILLWTEQGLSESVASLAIGIGVIVEVALMWWFRSLTQHVSARTCLLVAAACGMLRWSLLASYASLPVIFAAQALHGVTFGVTYLACVNFISRRVSEQAGARGQSLLATLTTACMAMATFTCGQLFDHQGSTIYWLMGSVCLLAMLCIFVSYRFLKRGAEGLGDAVNNPA